mgnify:CR=1 FL=1|jgi:hypothetical protein
MSSLIEALLVIAIVGVQFYVSYLAYMQIKSMKKFLSNQSSLKLKQYQIPSSVIDCLDSDDIINGKYKEKTDPYNEYAESTPSELEEDIEDVIDNQDDVDIVGDKEKKADIKVYKPGDILYFRQLRTKFEGLAPVFDTSKQCHEAKSVYQLTIGGNIQYAQFRVNIENFELKQKIFGNIKYLENTCEITNIDDFKKEDVDSYDLSGDFMVIMPGTCELLPSGNYRILTKCILRLM